MATRSRPSVITSWSTDPQAPAHPEPTSADREPAVLECDNLTVSFGGVRALQDVGFSIGQRQIIGLIGPNGAGKTTLVNALSGTVRPNTGDVRLNGKTITKMGAADRTRVGIARTFQAARVFPGMTVRENVEVASLQRGESLRAARATAEGLLEWIGLKHSGGLLAGLLPYGEQRRLAIARALATKPDVLMLDEPAAGMTEVESAELVDAICRLRDELNTAVIVVEHDMSVIMAVSDYVHVLVDGVTLVRDRPDVVRSNPQVIEAYLGGKR